MEHHTSNSLYGDHVRPGSLPGSSSSSSGSQAHRKHKAENDTPDQALQYATKEIILSSLFPPSNDASKWKYVLKVVQQPVRARMCGFGEKDRRSISPLPFVRLDITEDGHPVNIDELDPGFFVLSATLYEHKTNQDASLVIHPTSNNSYPRQSCTKNLVGNSYTHGKRIKDLDGRLGIWFVYQDLSVRTDGNFYLKFALTYVGCLGQTNTKNIIPMTVLATVDSEPFEVFSAKKFPGMIDTTPLSRCFGEQGIKIPTRSDKKTKHTSIEYNPYQRNY